MTDEQRVLIRRPSGGLGDLKGDEHGRLLVTDGVANTPHYELEGWSVVFPNSSAQYHGEEVVIPRPLNHSHAKYMVMVNNPSPDTTLRLSVRNGVIYPNSSYYAEILQKDIPISSYTAATATAWSSCFTSIGGVLTDESNDANDATPADDIPFSFGATNDAIYFGDDAKFQRLRINTTTANTNTSTFQWEYWNGDSSTWDKIPIITDNTASSGKPFGVTGWKTVNMQIPTDWAAYDIPSDPVSAYWVRCRCTSYAAGGVKPALSQVQYKPVPLANTYAYIIEGLFNGGDVKVALGNNTALTSTQGFTATVWLKEI